MLGISTPVSQGQYHRFVLDMFNEKDYVGLPTGFMSLFGRPESGSKSVFDAETLEFDIDIIRANERIASLVPRGTMALPVEGHSASVKEKFTERNIIPPLGEELSPIDANQLFMRSAGENSFQTRSRLDKMREIARELHVEQHRRFVRTFELLASTVILTGKMPAIIGTTDTGLTYDFKRKGTHTFTAGASWATAGTNILGDIDTGCELVRQDAHVTPDYALASSEAMAGILVNTKILANADNRRVDQGYITTNGSMPAKFDHLIKNGFTFRGVLDTPKGHTLHLFTYLDGYDNASGTYTKFLTTDKFVIGSTQARFDRVFGPGERLPMTASEDTYYQEIFGFSPDAAPMPASATATESGLIDPRMFHHDVIVPDHKKSLMIRTQCAPVFIPTMVDSIVVIDITP